MMSYIFIFFIFFYCEYKLKNVELENHIKNKFNFYKLYKLQRGMVRKILKIKKILIFVNIL